MNSLYRDAIRKASVVRRQLGVNMFQPINIFDSCINLGLTVRFVDVNMEGLYVKQGHSSTILISNKRPFPRRGFTCAHELGHHVFNHGLKVDILSDENEVATSKDDDEILVDAFAAALLMPVGGIQAEFAKRSWNFQQASPIDFYTVCSTFGVGYQTLVTHCKVNDLINESKADLLLKLTPAKIFKTYLGNVENKSYFKVIDQYSELSILDLEISNYIVLPYYMQVEGDYFDKQFDTKIGCMYIAKKAGISTAHSSDGKTSYFIRIQKENYLGLADYRHFEN